MLSTPEYAFRKRKKVTTVFRDKKIVWADCEEAKNYILEEMMTPRAWTMTAIMQSIFNLFTEWDIVRINSLIKHRGVLIDALWIYSV